MLIPNLNDIPELGPVPEGEYEIRVTKAKEKKYDSGAKCIMLICEIVGEENAETIFHNLWLPTDKDDESKKVNKLRALKDFVSAVGMDLGGIEEASEFDDLEFTALLVQTPHFADDSKMINEIKRVV